MLDIENQIRLSRKHSDLRETVTFKYIAAYLLRDGVINSEEFQFITVNPIKQGQMDTFLKLLISKNSLAFSCFVSALEEDYLWLAEDLKNQIVSEQEVDNFRKNSDQNVTPNNQVDENDNNKNTLQAISIDIINTLQQNSRLVRRWTSLAYRLGLDRQAQSIRVKVNINCEDLDQCIFYLINEWTSSKPKDANLKNLITALKAEEFNDVAVQLETMLR